MKKTLVSLVSLMMALPVMAAENCAYSPLQNLIRNVRDVNQVQELLNQNIIFDEKVRCGGSLLQLAILRGNPNVLAAILNQDRSRANSMVSLNAYPIQGAPQEIPVILFAAYYAPNAEIFQVLKDSGANVAQTDSQGRNLLWYMDQNPVLRNTDLSDRLNIELLSTLPRQQQTSGYSTYSQKQGGAQAGYPNAGTAPAQRGTGTTVIDAKP